MVETPLVKVARLLGGVALMQGRLGHQVLGQLMIAGTNELAVAGAAVVVAGSLQQRNTAAQVALRTAAPAIALYSLFERREQILLRHERSLQPREKALAARDFELETQYGVLVRRNAKLTQQNGDFQTKNADLEKKNTGLADTVTRLRRQKDALRKANALCVFDRSILRNRNDILRQELTALTERLRALEAPQGTEAGAAPAGVEGPLPPEKKRAERRQQRRAKRRDKKREQ